MRSVLLPLSLLPSVLGATIYLAGDSTMAASGGGSGTDGEKTRNSAACGMQTDNRRFDAIADLLQEGDYVVIEFGHNDGGSLSTDNGRTDCPGTGSETCETTYDGQAETVLTFPAYLENAAKTFVDKGAKVLISSQTPNNVWESGEYSYSPSRFVEYAQLAAETAGVDYVDHGAYVAARYEALGADTVNSYYPNDHTHTSPEGAQVVADAFLKAVACSDVALKEVLTSTDFPGDCL
ncbi:unnamed protein product [Aspergillus oryzae]|uniref:Unnamed protein product n=2 Tax=Aspergillus oryzae TaxID=5062 RepID=A0AAN5BR40_ASPOZ|nr:unnamed protein product [Aspergillus oryzae]GMF85113.1 unnamed protein product [Aspergillus oryzae]GMG05869.1 unnamed protein product [Aspergillus oryzae]GMG22963.1 unnamed protein product [Aspergillus oryzae]GMG43120.1 unnamed protein product [Aspergillus oryzae var. brunneus]